MTSNTNTDTNDNNNTDTNNNLDNHTATVETQGVLREVKFRTVAPTDIIQCWEIEKASYPKDEAASKKSLQYRQHHAAPYFRCAVLQDGDEDDEEDGIVGFICSTRCHSFEHGTMTNHVSNGPLLAIHSVVVREDCRRQGLASAMLMDYVREMRQMEDGVQKLVLLAKSHLLAFYVDCGFTVVRPSAIVHGQDKWYDLELSIVDPRRDLLNGTHTLGIECHVVDSFASTPGTGNPAAVVVLPQGTDPQGKSSWMQMVAAEFNLAETAFIWPRGQTELLSKEIHWHIRYYTPKVEVPLCGHATLASAAILYQTIQPEPDAHIVFHAKEDSLTMELSTKDSLPAPLPIIDGRNTNTATAAIDTTPTPDAATIATTTINNSNSNNNGNTTDYNDTSSLANGSISSHKAPMSSKHHHKKMLSPITSSSIPAVKIAMKFPAKPAQVLNKDDHSAVCKMLESAFSLPLNPIFIGLSDIGDVLVELTPESFQDIGYESLNYNALLEWDGYYRGVIICCMAPKKEDDTTDSSDDGASYASSGVHKFSPTSIFSSMANVDFYSRFFGPKAGIDEDPVTGSAHCVLGPYFSTKLNKDKVIGKQMSDRGGIVECWILDENKVTLVGNAITTMSGRLWI